MTEWLDFIVMVHSCKGYLSLTHSVQFSSVLLPYKRIFKSLQVMFSWRKCWVMGVWGKVCWYVYWKYCMGLL